AAGRSRTTDGARAPLLLDRGRAQPAGTGETNAAGGATHRLAPGARATSLANINRPAQEDGDACHDCRDSQDLAELSGPRAAALSRVIGRASYAACTRTRGRRRFGRVRD